MVNFHIRTEFLMRIEGVGKSLRRQEMHGEKGTYIHVP
jgi:hypothetical protein